jgi:hypothetical protein
VRHHHDTTPAFYEDRWVDIDSKIVPLMEALWARGFRTYSCCEEYRRHVIRVWFSDPESYERFHALGVPYHPVGGAGYVVDFEDVHVPTLLDIL